MRFLYPNGVQDSEGILQFSRDISQAHRAFWDAVEIQAWKNILFYLGLQRIEYSASVRFWRPKTLTRSRLPVTNKVKVLVNDLASKLVGFKPPITWGPGSDQEADYVASTVADRVNTVIEKEANIREHKPLAARWMATTGNCFLVTNYDVSPEHGTQFESAHRCLHCLTPSMPLDREATGGLCPSCGSQEVSQGMDGMPRPTQVPRFEPAIGGDGVPIGIDYPVGRHVTEIENVFTVRFDPYADRFHKSPYVRIAKMRPRSWIAERYGEAFAETVPWGSGGSTTSRLLEGLAVTAFGAGGRSAGDSDESLAAVERLWIRPHPEKAPEGIYAEIVGGLLAPLTHGTRGLQPPGAIPYPYHDERGQPMLNVVHLEFDQVPGRSLASTRLDDAVELQEDVNEYDAFIKQHARRMANAIWTLPRGSNVSQLTGEEGQYIYYDPLATGHRPERSGGVSIGQDTLMVRNQKLAEMDMVWGLGEVSRGEAPRGVTAYAALQMLDERAQQGQSNLFDNWALGWMEWSRQNLNIAREYWTDDRTLSVGVGKWAVRKYQQADLRGGVDISVDLGMNRPTTLIAKSARIGQALVQGLIDRMDPQVRFMGLRALGIPEMMPDYNLDYLKAGRMLDRILSAQTPQELPPPPQPFDMHEVHLKVLREFEVDEAFEALEPWKQQAILLRANIHYQALEQNMLRRGAGAGTNTPVPGGGGHSEGGQTQEKQDYTTEDTIMDKETQGATHDSLTGPIGAAVGAAQ